MYNNILFVVTATSASDIWAVGDTVVLHHDLNGWQVALDVTNIRGHRIHSIAARSATDVWVVGQRVVWPRNDPLTLHWDGMNWLSIISAPEGVDQSWFAAIAIRGQVIAAGQKQSGSRPIAAEYACLRS